MNLYAMNSIENAQPHMSLSPLGAGDLIDRAVRFYRKNFWTFVLISSPPVIVGTIFLVAWTTIGRSIFSLGSTSEMEVGIYRVFVALGNLFIWLIQMIATLVIMGGASRNFVRHLLYGEPITFRETYRNSVNRLWGLVGISTLISIICGIFGFFVFYVGVIIMTFGILAVTLLFQSFPIVAFIVGIIAAIAIIFGTLWVMFLLISRFVYFPQIMLVEGQGAFAAVSRSFAIENIYSDFRRRVSRLVGVDNHTTSRQDLANLVADRTEYSAGEIEAHLFKFEETMIGEPTGKKEIIELTGKLREVEKSLGLRRHGRKR